MSDFGLEVPREDFKSASHGLRRPRPSDSSLKTPWSHRRIGEHEEDLIQLESSPPLTTGKEVESIHVDDSAQNEHMGKTGSRLGRPEATILQNTWTLLDINSSGSKIDSSHYIPHTSLEKKSCQQCYNSSGKIHYCNVCDTSFCDNCWSRSAPHRNMKLSPSGVPHEKTDPRIAAKIRAIFEPAKTETQEFLHRNDEITKWFGVATDEEDTYLLQDYGRYEKLITQTMEAARASGEPRNRFPSLVSFVGQTGAGKSTLIKALIKLRCSDKANPPTPVVGSVNQNTPTSGDVHLYSDPETYLSEFPVLYADCEGLEGGEREPLGAISRKVRIFKPTSAKPVGRTPSFSSRLRRLHTSDREIAWASDPRKRTREFAVTYLYPRLLYTFSDVIVFVLREPRTIETVLEKLIDWAKAALETSSNQPVLPHAIIACNLSKNNIDERQWNVGAATEWLMRPVDYSLYKNKTFNEGAEFWNKRHKQIDSVEQLILSYYSSIRVVRIPAEGRPQLISHQITKLYNEIRKACEASRQIKHKLRMLLNAEELHPYLQDAFDHFSLTLDTPFDFVKASIVMSPIPLDFGGNILKLAIAIMETWADRLDGQLIFRELSYMVASCIMLDSVRRKLRGTAEKIFPEYCDHLDVALENFCDRHWPCEYVRESNVPATESVRCVNVRSGHGAKGHQSKNGRVLAVGPYESRFSLESHRDQFRTWVYVNLMDLLAELKKMDLREGSEEKAAAKIHQEKVLEHFYKHLGGAEKFKSHSACFSCLANPPQHPLSCGHILCNSCLQVFGTCDRKNLFEIKVCPLHPGQGRFTPNPYRVMLKPTTAGVRILTLDGGGIRGIVELEILMRIERALGGEIPIVKLIDLIVGTSTGGIIALGLGAKYWPVNECIQKFGLFCRKAFTPRRGSTIPGIGWLVKNHYHSAFKTKPLVDVLIQNFGNEDGDDYLFGVNRCERGEVKVAVTTASAAGSVFVLANYNRESHSRPTYIFQRPEKPDAELKIWEAARATSAAPTFFRSFVHKPSKQVFLDGGLYHNNPIKIAETERKLLWPTPLGTEETFPDIVLSLGTGQFPSHFKPSPEQIESPSLNNGIFSNFQSLKEIAEGHVGSSMESEKIWKEYYNNISQQQAHRYIRLNPRLTDERPELYEVKKMHDLGETVSLKLKNSKEMVSIAYQLLACNFYYETITRKAGRTATYVTGTIHCRFVPESPEIGKLGMFFRNKTQNNNAPYFVVQEKGREIDEAQQIMVELEVVKRMIDYREFRLDHFSIRIRDHRAIIEISLVIGDEMFAISGFPRTILQPEPERRSRLYISGSSSRWVGRNPDQEKRKAWSILSREVPRQLNSISMYSSEGYLVGDSTEKELEEANRRLTVSSSNRDFEVNSEAGAPRSKAVDTFPRSRNIQDNPVLICEMKGDSRYRSSEDIYLGRKTQNSIRTPPTAKLGDVTNTRGFSVKKPVGGIQESKTGPSGFPAAPDGLARTNMNTESQSEERMQKARKPLGPEPEEKETSKSGTVKEIRDINMGKETSAPSVSRPQINSGATIPQMVFQSVRSTMEQSTTVARGSIYKDRTLEYETSITTSHQQPRPLIASAEHRLRRRPGVEQLHRANFSSSYNGRRRYTMPNPNCDSLSPLSRLERGFRGLATIQDDDSVED